MREESFGVLLRHARAQAGMKAHELATAVGERPQTISNWERDKNLPATAAKVAELEEVLCVTDQRLLRAAGFTLGADVLADQIRELAEGLADLRAQVECAVEWLRPLVEAQAAGSPPPPAGRTRPSRRKTHG